MAGNEVPSTQPLSPRRAWIMVAALTFMYANASLDRQMMSLLVVPIQQDLGFSDMEIGVLQGAAFALFFVLASLPIGWMVDRISRRAVIFWGTVGWSLSAAASGLSHSFTQMFASRAGVGAGEATLQPAAFAILADTFPAERLALPMSVFVIGANVGSGLSFIFGGLAVEWAALAASNVAAMEGIAPWRLAFLFTALPGLLIAFLVFAIPRSSSIPRRVPPQDAGAGGDFAQALAHYRQHWRFFGFHNLAFAACIAFVIGLLAWNPAFLMRQYGWEPGRIGLWLGGTQIATSLLALAFHGWMVDRLFRRGMRDAHLRWFMIMCPLAALFASAAYLVDNVWWMLGLFNLGFFCIIGYPGVGASALQIATPAHLRGKFSAIYLIGLNLLGALSGPILVASITQYALADEARIGLAMAISSVILMAIGTVCCAAGMKPMRAVMKAAE